MSWMQKICLQQQLHQSRETALSLQQYCLPCITMTVVGPPIYYEAYLFATKDTIYVCLARDTGDPFISSLELRPLDTANMYKTVQQGSYLFNLYHANFGGSTPIIRYI